MGQITFQKICAWSGPVCVLMFFAAWVLAGFIPPLSPSLSVDQVVAHYQQHVTGIRIGMGIMLVSSMFYATFTGVMSGQMQRIPGVSPSVVYVQLAAGAFGCLTFMVPAIFFIATSFRPERSPEITYMLNDFSWIMMIIPWPPFMAQNYAFAFAIFSDKRSIPLFPRWLAFLNIWAPIIYSPAILLPFFKSGPFAYNGLLALYLPFGAFFTWVVVMTPAALKAIGTRRNP